MNQTEASREAALEAVRTLIRWAGDDPNREELVNTPERVVEAYKSLFSGYSVDLHDIQSIGIQDLTDYDESIILQNIRFESHCEHHMMPFIGYAHIAYLPNKFIAGIGKLASIVDIYAKRLQVQERLTIQIAQTIHSALETRGVAVVLEASHQCITCRGARKIESAMITSCMLGAFKENIDLRREVLELLKFHQSK